MGQDYGERKVLSVSQVGSTPFLCSSPLAPQLPGSSYARATQSSASPGMACCPRKRLSWAACSGHMAHGKQEEF